MFEPDYERGEQPPLFKPDPVDTLIDLHAARALVEISQAVERARRDTDARFDALAKFTSRSHGQTRRFFYAKRKRP